MIWQAQADDIPASVDLCLKFIAAAGLPAGSHDGVQQLVQNLMDAPQGVVFRSKRGVLIGCIGPLIYNPAYFQAHELAWWSEDGRGADLRVAFEQWAKDAGAHEVQFSGLESMRGGAVSRAMQMAGYKKRETSYVKVI